MDKFYQIFISATAGTLAEARRSVIKHIIDMKHMPISMQSFDATNASHWPYIQKRIGQSDYCVAIVPGDEKTQAASATRSCLMEFIYALEHGIPAVVLLGDSGPSETAREPSLHATFKELCENHGVRYWRYGEDPDPAVIAALSGMMLTHPRRGWVEAALTAPDDPKDRAPEWPAVEPVAPPVEPPTLAFDEEAPALAAALAATSIEVGSFQHNQYQARHVSLLDIFANTHYSFLSGLSAMDFLLLMMENYNGRVIKPDENKLLSELIAHNLLETKLPLKPVGSRGTSGVMYVLTKPGKDFAAYTHMMRLRENMDQVYGLESD